MLEEPIFILLGICLIVLLMFLKADEKLHPEMNNRSLKKKNKKQRYDEP